MNEKEARVQRAKQDVRSSEIRLHSEKEKMEFGVIEAKAVFDSKCSMLKKDWLIAQQGLEDSKVWLQEAETALDQKFDS